MPPHIFPEYRHLIVVRPTDRFPARILDENYTSYATPVGRFSKYTGRMIDDPEVKFEGPFTAEGDMEGRP